MEQRTSKMQLKNENKTHRPLPPCDCKCSTSLSRYQRERICNSYWKNSKEERQEICKKLTKYAKVARRTKTTGTSRRNLTLIYMLPNEAYELEIVCRTMFLTTLGYKPSNNQPIPYKFHRDLYAKTHKGEESREKKGEESEVTCELKKQ